MSSTMVDVWGSSSDSSIPHSPRGANFHGEAKTLELACAALSYLISPGNGWPSYFAISGFGSNRS